jgi:hypothetical protein
MISFQEVLAAGVQAIRHMNGEEISGGKLLAEKLRPSRRDGQVVLFVEKGEKGWLPLKLD